MYMYMYMYMYLYMYTVYMNNIILLNITNQLCRPTFVGLIL